MSQSRAQGEPSAVLVPGSLCTGEAVADLSSLLSDAIGRSVHVRPARGGTLAEAAASVLGATGRSVLVGHSFGGTVSLAAARLHPARVAALVLVATNPRPPRPEQLRGWAQQELVAHRYGPEAVADHLAPLLARRGPDGGIDGGDDGDGEGGRRRALLRRMAREVGTESFLEQLGVQRERVDERPGLRGFAGPLLAVSATHDRLVTESALVEIARTAPRGRHARLDAGHMLPLDAPEELAALVAHWWRHEVRPMLSPPRPPRSTP